MNSVFPKETNLIDKKPKTDLRWNDILWVAGIAVLFATCLVLFHRMIINYEGNYPSDMGFYAKTVFVIRARFDRLIELLSYSLYKINNSTTGFNIYVAAVIAAIVVANYYVLKFYIMHDGFSDYVPRYAVQAASLLMLFTGPIYFPYYHQFFYRGSFSSFAWHNPTQQSMTLFSLIATLCFLKMFLDYEKGVSLKWWGATAAMMFISAFAKPSFAFDMAFSVVVLFLLELFSHGTDGLRERFVKLFAMGCTLIPAGVYMIVIEMLEFGDSTLNGGAYYVRFGLDVFRDKSDVGNMFFFGMTFAIAVVIFNMKRFRDSKYFLAMMIFAFGVMQWALFAESGSRARHGNFGWGRMYGCYYLNLICMIILIENIFAKDSYLVCNKKIRIISIITATTVLTVSVLCQLNYFALILTGKGYWR